MQTAALYETRRFRLEDQPAPGKPGPGEVQVAVKAVGICGSDLHYFAEGAIGDTPCVYPMVLGHEPSGVVIETGAGVSGWAVGDAAVLEPALYCYHCEFCMSGRHNVCSDMKFLSSPGEPGFFRERVNLPAHNLLALPKNVGLREGSLVEPLSIILHSMVFAQPRMGETAAVFGAGPIGLLTVAVLKLSGVRRIWVVEPVAARRAMALAMGADVAIDPAATDPVKEIQKDTAGRGVDLTLDCATKADTINQSLHTTRSAGRVVITGVPSELRVALDFHTLRRKELAFYPVRRSNREFDLALRLIADAPQRFAPVLTHTRPLDRIQSTFEMLEKYEDGACKITLTM